MKDRGGINFIKFYIFHSRSLTQTQNYSSPVRP